MTMKRIFCCALSAILLATACHNTTKEDTRLLTGFYEYVFGEKEATDSVLRAFLAPSILERIWMEDYDGCYAIWEFRTGLQDGVSSTSSVESVRPLGDGWYRVSFLDLGVAGETDVKVENGMITDFRRNDVKR